LPLLAVVINRGWPAAAAPWQVPKGRGGGLTLAVVPGATVCPPVSGGDAVTVPQPAVTAATRHAVNPIVIRFI
jgi:hypothetical protein